MLRSYRHLFPTPCSGMSGPEGTSHPAAYGATTPPSCRQKTIDAKIMCGCYYDGRRRRVGGRGRAFWCGACLWGRHGENMHECIQRGNWQCPCCRWGVIHHCEMSLLQVRQEGAAGKG